MGAFGKSAGFENFLPSLVGVPPLRRVIHLLFPRPVSAPFFLPSFYPESTRVPTATPTEGHFETLLMSSQDLLGTLKRPRSTSRPPSPSSGSSPKRAASEDPFPSSSDSGRVFDHLITDNGSMVAASSPLRQDIGDNESNKSWVELTQQVKLGSDGEEDMKGDTTLRADGEPTLVSQEIWKERNNELLGALMKYSATNI